MHSLLVMALAAVGVSGGPVVVAETPGGAVSDFGSWYAVKAVTAGTRAQEPAALAIYDARPNTPGDRPVGTFSVQVRDEFFMPKLEGARAIAFRPHGWEEHPVDGALSADVSVFTLERNVFAVVIALHGVSAPLTFSAVLRGTGAAGGSMTGNEVTLDDGRGQAFGVFAGSTASVQFIAFTPGVNNEYEWQKMYPVTGDVTVGFVLAFEDGPGLAEGRGVAALAGHGAAGTWLTPVLADWAAYRASFPGVGAVPQAWADADANAQATLRMNRDGRGWIGLGSPPLGGIARSKTHADHFWLLDSPIAALAVSESSVPDAFQVLGTLLDAQVPAGASEAGLIPNHVDDVGATPSLNNPLATDAYSAPPVLPVVLRTLWERSAKDVAAQSDLERAYRGGAALHDWWRARRDLDGNGLIEVNGSVEAEMPDSPRFSVWAATANIPVPDSTPRARLNASDLNAWLQWSELELWRTGEVLGKSDASSWLNAANARASKIDDATQGFWDDEKGAWVDYALDANREKAPQGPRTPSSFWPFATGTERDPVRLRRAATGLTDPAQLWLAHGVPSVAATEIGFLQDVPWRGAISPWQTYFLLQGLSRFGFEAEAEALRTRLLDTLAAQPAMYAHYAAFTGVGLEAAGTSTTAAVFVEALRRRYEEETFALLGGSVPTSRQGQIRRMFRFSDGVVLAEISVDGTRELPRTHFTAAAAIFSGDPTALTFADPTGAVGTREITVSLPAFDQAEVEIEHGDGSAETMSLEKAPLSVTVRLDDTLRLQRYHFAGEHSCGCGEGGGAPLGALAMVIARAMASRKGRRKERRTASASQRGRRCL
ncbi:MAG TPA: trehalase family glycosidase [Myxococcaceae bacterium]|jgi:hypothetical protein